MKNFINSIRRKGISKYVEKNRNGDRSYAYYNTMVKELWEKQTIAALETVVNMGCEILEFRYKGLMYGIGNSEDQVFIGCSDLDFVMNFDSIRELIMYSMIDGKYLIDIRDELEFCNLF